MVKQLDPPTNSEIRTLLGDATVDSWSQDKVTQWLEDKGWGQFASTFEKHGICRERFFQITLAELVQYLPRAMTTYNERRRLLNEIRSLVPTKPGQEHITPTTPTKISINTNLHDYSSEKSNQLLTPTSHQSPRHSSDHGAITVRDSGIGYLYSAGSSSPSPSASPSSDHLVAPFRKNASPTRSSYSPKVAFNKIKNTFRSQQNSAHAPSPRSVRHESVEEGRGKRTPPAIPARVSSTPDKISKFWATYANWHSPSIQRASPSSTHSPDLQPQKKLDQRIQITADKETWYSLNVTNMRDPVAIKQHILKRMNFNDDFDSYQYFHENGSDPDTPMDPQELMYLCSIADHSASQRILVKSTRPLYNHHFTLSTPELGQSPTDIPQAPRKSPAKKKSSPQFRPLCRNAARRPYIERSVGIQLTDPPLKSLYEPHQQSWQPSEPQACAGLWAIPPNAQSQPSQLWTITPPSPVATPPHTKVPNLHPTTPSQPTSTATAPQQQQPPLPPLPSSQPPLKQHDAEFWGERPPAQVVFQHMEQYFDKQDLDKEVAVPVTTEPTTCKRTQSIRVVAREASRKYGRSMVRRKSTKLWGQRVVELKARSAQVVARLPSVSEHMRLSPHASQVEDVQWIRGKMIGKGSFGRVYMAFSVATGEVIAVKQVEVPRTASDLLNVMQHDMVEALYQEIMTLRDLDHEHIVQYLGYGLDDVEGVIHIFLEYVSGGSVASRLALHGAFDEHLTQYFTRQICSGLEYLHSKHILHRDIKAANILVEVDGICKISDFGLSKKNDYDEVYDQNSRMSLQGSIYWMAPEVVKNEPYSAKVDIWSLGCTVIEMLTGQRPWIALNQIATLYNLGRLNTPTLPDNISDCAKDFLKQCFIIDPLKRPTATDLLAHEFLRPDKSFNFKDYVDKGKI